jgi:uncharacterized protein (UPF0210 family)
MMATRVEPGEVKLRLDHIRAVIEGASPKALYAAALQIEGAAKIKVTENDQVDTGFMRSAIYSVGKADTNYPSRMSEAAEKTTSARTGRAVGGRGRAAPARNLRGTALAAVVAGASYSIYQEVRKSFLFAGAQEAVGEAAKVIEKVYQEEVRD